MGEAVNVEVTADVTTDPLDRVDDEVRVVVSQLVEKSVAVGTVEVEVKVT